MRFLPDFLRFHRAPAPAPRPRWHSVSSTHEYERCPRRYRFAYVDRVRADRGLAPEGWRFGSVVHAGLEAGYRHHAAEGFSENLRHAIPVARDAVRHSWVSEAMPDDGGCGRAERIVARSLAGERLPPHDILGVEHYFRAESPEGFRIAGAADLIVRPDLETIEIRDHKVTRYARTPEQLAGDFQLNVYGWLARQTWPWAKRIVVAHHYPLLQLVVRAELDDAQVDAAVLRMRSTAAQAEADTEFTPNPGEHCATCVYAPQCPAAVATAA